MQKFNLYCDESCYLENDNKAYMIMGTIKCPKESRKIISKEIRDIFHSLSNFARQHGSIFDLFKKGEKNGDVMLSTMLKDSGVSKDKISDILIDLHSLADKDMKGRLQEINLHAAEDAFYEGINARS